MELQLPDRSTTTQQLAIGLGLAGLLPFVAGFLLVSQTAWLNEGSRLVISYGAVILAFVGAIHWPLALLHNTRGSLVFSVLPALLGFAALMLPVMQALLLLAAAFSLCAAVDVLPGRFPAWYRRLRLLLSTLVLALIAGTYFALL